MKNIALVHDFLLYYGGAEGVLKVLSEMYAGAPIFTLLSDKKITNEYFKRCDVKNSFLEKSPKFFKKRHKYLFPFMPTAIETFNLRDFDVVISSSSAFAKGIVIKPKTIHICYMHSPMRYVWDFNYEYLHQQKLKGKTKLITRLFLNYLRIWDRASAERVDYFIANSKYTAERIEKYYRKKAHVIYPPVHVERFQPKNEHLGYFLSVGRLSPYKCNKLMIDVFLKLKLPLVVVGVGAEYEELKQMSAGKDNIKIIGWIDDEKLVKLYQNARAFVSASEDDFNITIVEAMASGKPVIALKKGGATETIIEGVTGEFFEKPQMEIMADGIRKFIENEKNYDASVIRKRAEEFGVDIFRRKMKEFVGRVTNK